MRTVSRWALAAIAVLAVADEKSPDRRRLESLEREIRAEVATPRAAKLSQCRAIAFGAKPCGGPWRYLIFSTSTSDVERLETLVAEYNALERKINKEEGRASDCSFVGKPGLALRDGICQRSSPAR